MLDTAREPPWMTQARGMLGKAEIPGPQTAPFISNMLQSLGAWWRDDETAWCATFVSACLHDAGLAYPKAFYRARAFETWGRPWVRNAASIAAWDVPYGAIAVLSRPPRPQDGHVALLASGNPPLVGGGELQVPLLGGNQGNRVSVMWFPLDRVVAWRWPTDYAVSRYQPTAGQVMGMHFGAHTGADA
jgi:uncharacterized protein (TIGR02594 family)